MVELALSKPTRRAAVRGSRLSVDLLEERSVPATLTLSSGVLTYTAATGINNNVSVTISGSNFVFADSGETITTTISGATGNGTNSVTVATSGVTGIVLNLDDGSDAIGSNGVVVAGHTVTINQIGTELDIRGPITTTNSNLSITANNQINLRRAISTGTGTITIAANQDGAGSEGFTQIGTAAITAASWSSNVATLTANSHGFIVGDSVTVAGMTPTGFNGTFTITAATTNIFSYALATNPGTATAFGTATLSNSITTTNTTNSALSITANKSSGGTGNISLDNTAVGSSTTGGRLTLNSNGGSILYAGSNTLTTSQQGTANGGSSTGRNLIARSYVMTATGAGSIGTNARPIQTAVPNNGTTISLTAGTGGIFLTDWNQPVVLSQALADGGDIRVVTANVGGHNLTIDGQVHTGNGNIFLASDDNFIVNAGVTIGGTRIISGTPTNFAGRVWIESNRDRGTAGQPLQMAATSSIITTNTTNNSVLTTTLRTTSDQAVYLGAEGDDGTPSPITLGNITVGNGGRIVVNASPRAYLTSGSESSAGTIAMAGTTNLLDAGSNGTIGLNARITATTAADAIGTSASPIRVAGGNVLIYSNFGNVFVTGTAATTMATAVRSTTSQTAAFNVNLATTSGVLTIDSAPSSLATAWNTNTAMNGGTYTLTGNGGVAINAAINSAAAGTGTITINAGTHAATLNNTLSLNASQTLSVTANSEGLKILGSGELGGTGASSNSYTVTQSSTALVTPAGTGIGILATGNFTGATGSTVRFNVNNAGTAGTNYDQLKVTGTVDLNDATLNVLFAGSYTPTLGDAFTLIDNDGSDAITGTFLDLPQNAFVSLGGNFYQISYVGGTGNDVVLTRANPVSIYVDDAWSGFATGQNITDADPVADGDQAAVFGTTAFASVNAAIAASSTGGVVVVNAGAYSEAVVVDKTITLVVQEGAVSFQSLADTVNSATLSLSGVTLTVGSNDTSTSFGSTITGTGTLAKTGTGTMTLGSTGRTNDYTGGTTVNGGILTAAAASAFGSNALTTIASGTTLQLAGFNQSLGNLSGAGTINSNSTTAATLTLTNTANSSFTGAITQSGTGVLSVVKSGSGTLTLSGTNTCTGTTNVSAGTLAGTATLAGNLSVANGATLVVATTSSTGTLTTGNLSLASNATLRLNADNTTAGTGYDQIVVNGTVTLGGNLLFTPATSGWKLGDTITLIANDGTDAVSGSFASNSYFRPSGSPFLFQVTANGGDGNDVVATVVSIRHDVNEDAAPSTFDLSAMLAGATSYSVIQTNSSGLITPSISGSTLTLTYAANSYGYSYLTVTATNGSTTVTRYIEVVVKPVDDAVVDYVNAPTSGTININVLSNDGSVDRTVLVEAANINVVQNDINNNTTSVTVTTSQATTDFFIRSGSNRGDYNIQIGSSATDDVAGGLLFSSVRENGRDNGETVGVEYSTSAIDSDSGGYFIPIHASPSGSEYNVNVSAAYFNYTHGWIAGWAVNNAGTNGGANNTLRSVTPNSGLTLVSTNTFGIRDLGSGQTRVSIPGVNSQTDGILLAIHGKNEDNIGLGIPNADGSWNVIIKDNETNGSGTEQDPPAFVYIPIGAPNIVSGRILGNGTVEMASGNFTVTKSTSADGTYILSIPGQSPTTGVLILSPEGGDNLNVDNIVSYQQGQLIFDTLL